MSRMTRSQSTGRFYGTVPRQYLFGLRLFVVYTNMLPHSSVRICISVVCTIPCSATTQNITQHHQLLVHYFVMNGLWRMEENIYIISHDAKVVVTAFMAVAYSISVNFTVISAIINRWDRVQIRHSALCMYATKHANITVQQSIAKAKEQPFTKTFCHNICNIFNATYMTYSDGTITNELSEPVYLIQNVSAVLVDD